MSKQRQFNKNKESYRHRCADCGRMRKAKFMRCLNKMSSNGRDSQWKCKTSCKENVIFKNAVNIA